MIKADICILGGGSGGLSVAAGAAQMGAKVVLIEPGPMGGDCLNYGCVPSKALLAAAHRAHDMRHAEAFGIKNVVPEVDMAAVADHIAQVIATIAPHDSVERFEGLGVQVVQERGTFISAHKVKAGDQEITAKYFVIATGSSAMIPPIEGLENISYFTNETIFSQREAIPELLVMGGGPIGMELAQAHHRLGSKVTVIEMMQCLAKDDQACAEVVKKQFADEGIRLFEQHRVSHVRQDNDLIVLRLEHQGEENDISGTHLLVAAGRRAVVDGLGLEAAGIQYSARGIQVDTRLRTNRKHIFAIGDVTGGYQFTHTAGYHAGIVVMNCLFRLPAKARHHHMPWVTYTDPELAHVGETAEAARTRLGNDAVTVTEVPFANNDRAIAERQTLGMIRIVSDQKQRLLGVDIVGTHAGEMILLWQDKIGKKRQISKVMTSIAPYPTRSELSKRVAGKLYTPKLFSTKVQKIVRFLLKLPF